MRRFCYHKLSSFCKPWTVVFQVEPANYDTNTMFKNGTNCLDNKGKRY